MFRPAVAVASAALAHNPKLPLIVAMSRWQLNEMNECWMLVLGQPMNDFAERLLIPMNESESFDWRLSNSVGKSLLFVVDEHDGVPEQFVCGIASPVIP